LAEANVASLARSVLDAAEPAEKVAAAYAAVADLGPNVELGAGVMPQRPARPERPRLAHPTQMPRRRTGGLRGRIAMLHALAHIELNAIDLAFDMAGRFAASVDALGLDGSAFAADWFQVGAEEAGHFQLIADRLAALGARYGDLDAHDGLWEAALRTADDVAARLAVAPLVLEARGLDATPAMAQRLSAAGDAESAQIIHRIHTDEIGHVGCGARWFARICKARGDDPQATFERLVESRFPGGPKPPYNQPSRRAAGMPDAWYARWNANCEADEAHKLTIG
jgi:uncharacterized ferritin-like protein (DUF455 family)